MDRGRLALEGAHLAQLKLHPTSPPPALATTYHKLQQSHCWVRTQQTRNQLLRELCAPSHPRSTIHNSQGTETNQVSTDARMGPGDLKSAGRKMQPSPTSWYNTEGNL